MTAAGELSNFIERAPGVAQTVVRSADCPMLTFSALPSYVISCNDACSTIEMTVGSAPGLFSSSGGTPWLAPCGGYHLNDVAVEGAEPGHELVQLP